MKVARGPFAVPGRLVALPILALLALLRAFDPGFVEDTRMRGFDVMHRIAPRAYEDLPVRVVEIDEETLRRQGQWPWPRTQVAELVEKIAAMKPLAMGFDIIFAELDRLSPDRIPDVVPGLKPETILELRAMPSSEDVLAAALRTLPAALGVGPSMEEPQPRSGTRYTVVREVGGDPRPVVENFPSLVRSRAEIAVAERGRGLLGGEPDRDGILRRVPLIVHTEGRLVPAMSVELLRIVSNNTSVTAMSSRGWMDGVMVGDLFMPTDGHGKAYPYYTPSLDARYVSANSILDGTADRAQIEGKVLMLGVTGLGLIDIRQTPVGLMQGVEIHAQLIENMVTGQLLRRPPWTLQLELGLIGVIGLLVIFVLPFNRPIAAAGGFVAVLALLLGSELAAFRLGHYLVDTIYPAGSATIIFGLMVALSFVAAELARRRLAVDLAQQRQITARLEGELNAARAIQLGLLPRRFPERNDVELYATMEAARTVGGDLYDYLVLDGNRLLFAVADVSGKGIPAALFMAMTIEVLHAAAVRHGNSLDAVMADANNKIAEASNDLINEGADMMFVTCLAGILDLHSGEVIYVSAGHDAPFSLVPGAAPIQLVGDGGPPLGAVDDFPFPMERHMMQPGETLVLFTDGVTEAEDMQRALYGTDRLLKALTEGHSSDAKEAVAVAREDLRRFVAEAEQADDITLMALRWLGPQAPKPISALSEW